MAREVMKAKAWGKRLCMAPVWIVQVATSAKSFLDNPILGSARCNRYGLHVARVRWAAAMVAWRRRRLARHVRPDWKAAFDRDGYVCIDNVLPADAFAEMREAILHYQAPVREMRQGNAITRRMAIDGDMLRAIPKLQHLLKRKDLTALFHYVASFRTEPLHYIQTIISHVEAGEADPQEALHADSFHSSLKAWLFLNPVAADSGPFTYVTGSHLFTPERLAWEKRRSLANPQGIDRLSARGSPRVTQADLRMMRLPDPQPFPVPANTLLVADTLGFHARGQAIQAGERVEIWSYARRNPFLPWLGGDLLSLPGLAERRVGWLWALRDRLEKQIGQPWKPAGIRSAVTSVDQDTVSSL